MRGHVSGHKRAPAHRRAGSRLLAIVAVAAVGFAQFWSSWHEATVQHVRCAEHGELTEVHAVAEHRPVTATEGDTVRAKDPTGTAHEHCGFVFAAQGAAPSSLIRTASRFCPPPVVTQRPGDQIVRPERAFVLASAPKTSPPSV
jgi:hypothetical protein